jgi:hypothetical protein
LSGPGWTAVDIDAGDVPRLSAAVTVCDEAVFG